MNLKQILALFGPAKTTVSVNEKVISALAALVSIGLIMLVSQQFLDAYALPWIVASMGASAVLLFAVPKGPLSQPWPFIAGHLLSAFIGISIAKLISDPLIAASLAVSLAIFVMYLTRSLHPPGGATALTAVVGGSAIADLGYWYMLTPITINIIVMLIWALIINNLLPNRCYPNGIKDLGKSKKHSDNTQEDALNRPNLLHRNDLHNALKEMDVFIDVSEDELNKIFNLSLMHTHKKKMGEILCRDIMTSNVISVDYDTDIEQVWELLVEYRVHAFPVIDRVGHVLGVISMDDFLNQIKVNFKSSIISQLSEFILKTDGSKTEKPEFAGHLMTKPAITINEKQHILDLFELFYSHQIHHLPVINEHYKLVGIITPKDLLLAFQNSDQ
ncbi:HPP family protein [sulfur-oxidizing endosymbiont of Gigantopelta aegis]|uniref:HPP family protein n=1 Tax=sulfur-oxidizing endosymbiont of Gigantopelta aegis TaxID=2794934 RepID=UPI0018DC928F|nr:HPP family protein [sulfur-oxidizing endosymbiont of Gigantopelta aegis]